MKLTLELPNLIYVSKHTIKHLKYRWINIIYLWKYLNIIWRKKDRKYSVFLRHCDKLSKKDQ